MGRRKRLKKEDIMYYFEPLTGFLDSIEAKFNIPAVEVAVMKGGELIYRHAAGYSDPEKTKPVSDKDLYWIFSSSKISTCTAALKLIEDGVIGLDDPVSKYLPNYANLTVMQEDGTVVPAKNVMTIRHLMSMCGGLDYDGKRGSVEKVIAEKGEAVTTADICNAFADGPLVFDPGTHFRYSLCHDVLGGVIEVASGMRFGEYLEKNIFAPLGMTDTTFHPTEEQIERISTLYRAHEDEGTNEIIGKRRITNQPDSYESGGGGLVSSTDDYLKLGAALANKGTGLNGYQLLKPETVELFRTPQLGEVQHADFTHDFGNMVGYTYCLGARRFIDNRGFAGALGNFGWDGAAGFYILVDPDNDLTIIFAENIMSSGETYRVIHPMIRDLVYMALYYNK